MRNAAVMGVVTAVRRLTLLFILECVLSPLDLAFVSPTVWMIKTVRKMRSVVKVHVVVSNASLHFQRFMRECVQSQLGLVFAAVSAQVIQTVLLIRSAAAMVVDILVCHL
jgi:hypothetical protein